MNTPPGFCRHARRACHRAWGERKQRAAWIDEAGPEQRATRDLTRRMDTGNEARTEDREPLPEAAVLAALSCSGRGWQCPLGTEAAPVPEGGASSLGFFSSYLCLRTGYLTPPGLRFSCAEQD